MPASRTGVMLSLLSMCAVALLLSPASADPAAGGGSWPADSPAEAPTTAVAATLEWAEDDEVADADTVAVPPGRQAFRLGHHPSALSPEQRRGLEHEARCGPRVPVRKGVFPWPGWNPRCRGGAGAGDAAAPAVHRRLRPLYDTP